MALGFANNADAISSETDFEKFCTVPMTGTYSGDGDGGVPDFCRELSKGTSYRIAGASSMEGNKRGA